MNREQQRVIEAAENLVQFLDPASVADQAADPILVTERNWAEHLLCAAVGEMITERALACRVPPRCRTASGDGA